MPSQEPEADLALVAHQDQLQEDHHRQAGETTSRQRGPGLHGLTRAPAEELRQQMQEVRPSWVLVLVSALEAHEAWVGGWPSCTCGIGSFVA